MYGVSTLPELSGLPGVLEVVTGNRRWEVITYDLEIMLQGWLELPV